MIKIKENIKIILFALVVFCLAVSVWYSPTIFKGYSPSSLSSPILLARNLIQSNIYSLGNNLNVVLAPSLIKQQGQISAAGNKLSSIAYSKLFKITGLPDQGNLVLISIFIHAFALIIFALTVLYLFNFKIASVFSLIYILLPFNWKLPYHIGVYGFSLLFFALFFLFYFYGIRHKREHIYLIPAGLFLALACLSKEVILLFIPFLFIYLWIVGQKRYLLYIFIPLAIILNIYWLPDIVKGRNAYLFHLPIQTSQSTFEFDYYGEFFPDPYIFHFEREEFLKKYQMELSSKNVDFFEKIRLIKSSSNTGIESPSIINRIKIGLSLTFRHLSKFLAIEYIGGPLILLLILLGALKLKQKNSYLYKFFLYWISSVIFLLSFVFLVGRSHLMDFGWAIALLISLGIFLLIEILNNYLDWKGRKHIFLSIGIIFLVLYSLVLADHVVWGKIYNDERERNHLLIERYSQKIRELDIADQDVIAISSGMPDAYRLNYLTNKSIVIFQSETIETLLVKEEIDSAFKRFGIKYILGYSDKLTEKILDQAEVDSISTNGTEIEKLEVSPTKVWFLNLIK